MASITQDIRFRLSLIKYSQKHGVSKADRKYRTNRQYIYRWLKRYDATIESLGEKSRRPLLLNILINILLKNFLSFKI